MPTPATARFAAIRLLACDVDGVLTDGRITYGTGQVELKSFNIKDGLGIKLAGWAGLPVVLITGRMSEAVARRAQELEVEVYQGALDKDDHLRRVAADHSVALDEIAYIGDDLNDLPALRIAGLPITVADAATDVIAMASYVTTLPGGQGAVREVIEMILRAQGRWTEAVDVYIGRLRPGTTPQ